MLIEDGIVSCCHLAIQSDEEVLVQKEGHHRQRLVLCSEGSAQEQLWVSMVVAHLDETVVLKLYQLSHCTVQLLSID